MSVTEPPVSMASTSEPQFAHDNLCFDPKLKPKAYDIAGISPESTVLFRNVRILDSTGKLPCPGDVLVCGQRFAEVGIVKNVEAITQDPSVRIINGQGRTLMSGLGDAHAHPSWDNTSLDVFGPLGLEEHTLATARFAKCFLDSGYTMCFGAASAKDWPDIVIRNSINAGLIPGPRLLANGREIAVPDGELVPGITAFASGSLEMREMILHHVKQGVD